MNQGKLKIQRKNFYEESSVSVSSSDLAVILPGQNQTFLINKKDIFGIQLFQKQFLQKQLKVCMLSQKLDSNSFQKIMKCLSGLQCTFQRNQEVIKLLQIINFIKANQLMTNIINDMLDNFDEYSFFILFRIGQIFSIPKLKQKCLQQLLCMQFQQFNFNRYELLQCSLETFQYLLKTHHYFQQKKIIKGQDQKNIKQIIEEYCLKHSIQINSEAFNELNESNKLKINQVEVLVDKKFQQGWLKFRTPSFDLSALSQSINFGKNSSKQDDSPIKLLKKTSDSINLNQNSSELVEKKLTFQRKQSQTYIQNQNRRNFSMFCEQTQNKFLSSHSQRSILSNSNNSIQQYGYYSKTPVTPDTPETPKNTATYLNYQIHRPIYRRCLKNAISFTQ